MKLVNIHLPIMMLLFIIAGFSTGKAQVWSLQQCIDTALVYNKNLQMSRNTMSLGLQKEQEAKANLWPKITANAEYKYFTNLPYQLMPLSTFNLTAPEGEFREIQFGVPHNINANLQMTMPLYNPQVYGAIKTTQMASALNELQLQKTQEQIYFEIYNLYYNAQIVHHQLAFIDSNLVNAQKLLSRIQLLHQQMLAKGTDVSKVKLQLAQLVTQREKIQSTYTQVLNALKFAIGIPLEQPIEIDPAIEQQNQIEYTSTTTLDMRMISIRRQLLTNELSTLNKSRYLPSLTLFATFGTTGFGYNGQPNSFLDFYPIGFAGVQLSYPLFNGTVTQRKMDQKTLELQNNQLQMQWTTEQTNLQVENAWLQSVMARTSIETSREHIYLAQEIYTQSILLQKQGMAELTEVLLADNALREAQQNYVSALVEQLKADLELRKLTGNIPIHN